MAGQKLTATKIEKHKPTKNDESLADGNGLYLRFRRGVGGALSRVWMYTYKVGPKSVYLTLGEHQSQLIEWQIMVYGLTDASLLTLEIARKIAVEMTAWRKRGIDPKQFIHSAIVQQELTALRVAEEAAAHAAEDENLRRQADAENLTVQNMFDAWLLDGVRRKDGNAELRRSFNADVLPAIGHISIRDLTEHELRAILRTMVARGVNRSSVMIRNSLTQMFAWAEKRQPWRKLLVNGDPMDLIEIEKIVAPDYDLDNQRDRVLSVDEIRELRNIFQRLRTEHDIAPNKRVGARPVERTTELALWIMLSTLCRVGEMSMARWDHVDFNAACWHVPKGNVKNSVADLDVFLSPFSLEKFRQLYELTGHTDWCFPGRGNESHLDVKSISKQVGDRQAKFKKAKDGTARKPMKNRQHSDVLVLAGGQNGAWTPHDLRRTGATMMQSMGVSLEIIDRCQNHVLPGSKVRRHYLHHNYAAEKREAWRVLGARLSSILLGTG